MYTYEYFESRDFERFWSAYCSGDIEFEKIELKRYFDRIKYKDLFMIEFLKELFYKYVRPEMPNEIKEYVGERRYDNGNYTDDTIIENYLFVSLWRKYFWNNKKEKSGKYIHCITCNDFIIPNKSNTKTYCIKCKQKKWKEYNRTKQFQYRKMYIDEMRNKP